MIILPLAYDSIPNNIPAFLDFFGNTLVSMEKSYISIFRLPLMGLLLSLICIIMYSFKLTGENEKINKMVWSVVALIGALKMGITSLEILFYENAEITKIFRLLILILVLAGVGILIYGLVKMYRNKIQYSEYGVGIKSNRIKIIVILCLYIAVVLMPVVLKT